MQAWIDRWNRGRFTTGAVAVIAVGAFVVGSWTASSVAVADVTPAKPRDTFKDGGVISSDILREQLVVIKRIDERIGRIEAGLTQVLKK